MSNDMEQLQRRLREAEAQVEALRSGEVDAVVGQRGVSFLREREYEEKYRRLFETMGEGFVAGRMIYDDDGRPVDYQFTEINPAYERLTGLNREESLRKTIRELIPSLEPDWIEQHARVVETGEAAEWESYNAHVGRHYRVYTYRPEPDLFASIFTDITARKEAEDASQRAHALAQARLQEIEDLYTNAPVGLCVLDRELRFLRINERLAEINGFTAAEHIGRTIRELLPQLASLAALLDTREEGVRAHRGTGHEVTEMVREDLLRGPLPHAVEAGVDCNGSSF